MSVNELVYVDLMRVFCVGLGAWCLIVVLLNRRVR